MDPHTKNCTSYGIFATANDEIYVNETQNYGEIRLVKYYHSHFFNYSYSDKVVDDPRLLVDPKP